ncbi:zinc ribbon domain-containing protein [Methanobrevibacter sp.]|uniref:zinc ribbon domain-containing protein n=1 Tax=Methanobrevibacter sp. TaxID=66852 RepID=UPI003890A15F
MVFCSKCGKENSSSNIYCSQCDFILMKDEYFNLGRLNSFNEIINDENLKILEENPLTEMEYAIILKNITRMAHDYLDDLSQEFKTRSTLGKIKLLALSYADVSYKSRGAEFGSYSYNHIEIDDRLNDCDIISTLIHELTHHLFNEIFEQMLMYIWEVEKSDALEAYVSFTLGINPVLVLANEYCAHTVEGRFIPYGYQNYGSFNNLLVESFDLEKDSEIIYFALKLGNSIADDIIHILEGFVTAQIRHDIKDVFKNDYAKAPDYDAILLESSETFTTDEKLSHMHVILMSGITIAGEDVKSEEIFKVFENGYVTNNR